MTKLMNVREVAAYLNLKERKIYDLVKQGRIPCSRVTGKWLFPQDRIDQWVSENMREAGAPSAQPTYPAASAPPAVAPPVIAGSHDPLLEWALHESDCGLALMAGGSLDGLRRLSLGEARVCGMHVLDPASGAYNVPVVQETEGMAEVVLIEWGWRTQGLVVAPGNPLGLTDPVHLTRDGVRLVRREAEAGTQLLLDHLLRKAEHALGDVRFAGRIAHTHTEVGLAVLEGHADAGLAVEAVARQMRLDFIPLHRERYDLALRRRDYFEPPIQALLRFARSPLLHARARELGGYDLSGQGTVHYNAP